MPTQKIWVKGLKHGDEERVARRLREIEGVFAAVLNHRDQCAEVEFADDRVSPDDLRRELRAIGYEAEIAG